jgi:hypothetical protein
MRRVIATALFGGCISVGASWAADPAPVNVKEFPPGVAAKPLNDQQDERAVLAGAANAALTKGGFDDLCERLTSGDRKRFGDQVKRDTTELDGRIEQIQKIWNEKYGQKFNMPDKALESFVVIREGEVVDASAAKAHWPVMAVEGMFRDRTPEPSPTSAEYHGNQVFLNLKDRLTRFGENVSAWPADVNEAYRQVAHNVYAAIYSVPPREFGVDKAAGVGMDR